MLDILRIVAVIAVIAASLWLADRALRVTPLTARRVATVVALIVTVDFCLIWLAIRAGGSEPWGVQETAMLGVFAFNGLIVFAGAYVWYKAMRKAQAENAKPRRPKRR